MRNFNTMNETQYKEYMKHYNAVANAFATITEYAGKIDAAKLDYYRKAYEVAKDNTITETYRAERMQEVHNNAMQRLEACWMVVENIFPGFSDEVDAIAERLDLNDGRLVAAVTIANATNGNGIPSNQVQSALIDPFSGNAEALKMLRSVATSAGMSEAATKIDAHLATINKANAFAEAAEQMMHAAVLAPNGDFVQFALAPYAEAFAKVYGFTNYEIPEELNVAAVRLAMGLQVTA